MIIALKDEGRPSSDPGCPNSGQSTPLPRRASTWGRRGSDRATCGPDARDDQRSLTVHRGSSAARDLHICNGTPSQVDHYRSSKLNRPSQWLRQGLDLLPGRSGKADEAITH